MVLASASKDGALLLNLKKKHESDNAEWEDLLKAVQDKLKSLNIVYMSSNKINTFLKSWQIRSTRLLWF